MANQAKVTSIDVLEELRAALIVFVSKARRAADHASDKARRMRAWLQNDQRMHWEGEIRRRKRALDQATQELYSARLAGQADLVAVRQIAVRKMRHIVEEAEGKLQNVKRWNQNFGTAADPLLKKVDSLREFMDHAMPDAIAYLSNAQKSLEAYAEDVRPAGEAPGATPSTSEGAEPGGSL